ncbi:MAG TPA: N-acetyltransferase [Candidatus Ornithospirochaeta avicola]|uniref:N-acetyltransferase n=1 Tax=Candidatus Ornithospirochaeta avicola TaxID=2840896 RepID=A0A9D1PUH5_9SPIO|nr:N-acetyltransferase [Candidatus Ornithospirochaeta avicola]
MNIIRAEKEDIDNILIIYEKAKAFMRRSGNSSQWSDGYPSRAILLNDIERKELYKIVDGKSIMAVFLLMQREEKTYREIEGSWLEDSSYLTIHRIAKADGRRGILQEAVQFAERINPHIRIDTHHDNKPMQKVLLSLGFTFCGIIHLENGEERLAYEKT